MATSPRKAVLHGPPRVHIFLAALRGHVGPVLGHLASVDRLVLIAGVVVARHRHDGRIEDLPAPRDVALPRQIAVELAKQFLACESACKIDPCLGVISVQK